MRASSNVCLALLLLAGDAGVAHGFVTPATNLAHRGSRSPSASNLAMVDPLVLSQGVNDWISSSSSSSLLSIAQETTTSSSELVTYSKASYYTILGLYVMSFPGLWSQIKRSTTAKIKRKTYVSPGEKAAGGSGKDLRQQAGEIMACE